MERPSTATSPFPPSATRTTPQSIAGTASSAAGNDYVSDIQQKEPKGRPMSEAIARANVAAQRYAPSSSTSWRSRNPGWACSCAPIGIARARMKIGMANLAYNLTRFVWHQGRTASA